MVNNGVIVYDGLTSGSTARLVCNNGYTASKESRDRLCLNQGIWSGETQVCTELGKLIINFFGLT